MTERLSPETPDAVLAAVRGAVADGTPLEITGGGTKRGWGVPVETNHRLDLSALSGVTLYEPEELVLSARAATPLAEIEALLADHGQMLAFEPPEAGPVFGQPAGRQTLGGVIATNLSGPRRIRAGAARDHLLGFSAVSGRGEVFRSGGRVVKNVTGYDLSKLIAGSFGTLGVITELTVKVLPRPEKTRTVLVYGLSEADGVAALAEALNAPHDVSAAAHLPAGVAARSAVSRVRDPGRAVSAARVEGPAPSVEHRCRALRDAFAARGETEELHGRNSGALWAEIGGVAPLLPHGAGALWRVSVPPADGPAVAARIRAGTEAETLFDWGGGRLWVATEASETAEQAVRTAFLADGHATLVAAPADFRRAVPVFQPTRPALAALEARLRAQFDPKGLLNPGRMGGGG